MNLIDTFSIDDFKGRHNIKISKIYIWVHNLKIRKRSYNPSVSIDKAVGLFMPFHCDNCIHRLRVSHENYGFGLVCPYCKEGIICPDPSFHAGEQIGPYVIDGWLARGAMGEVYYAHSTKTDKVVALKILNTDIGSEYALHLFQQEAYIMGHFEHPCLPVISSTNQHESFYYLAMKYVEGEGYDTVILREKQLDQKYVINVMLKIADLLEHVWSKFGAIHRDIKPANIMVTEDDKTIIDLDTRAREEKEIKRFASHNCRLRNDHFLTHGVRPSLFYKWDLKRKESLFREGEINEEEIQRARTKVQLKEEEYWLRQKFTNILISANNYG